MTQSIFSDILVVLIDLFLSLLSCLQMTRLQKVCHARTENLRNFASPNRSASQSNTAAEAIEF